MKDFKIIKELLEFLKMLKTFLIENETQKTIAYLNIMINDLEKLLKEYSKEDTKTYDLEF